MHYDGAGRRYDPTLNGGRGGWPEPPRPWLDEPAVVAAAKEMQAARTAFDNAFDHLCSVHSAIATLALTPAEPALLYTGVNVPQRRSASPAQRVASAIRDLEDGELVVAKERSDRCHAEWCAVRDRYETIVASHRARWQGHP